MESEPPREKVPPPLAEPEPESVQSAPEAPPPPPAPEAEPLDGLALVRTIIIDRVKSNPVPLVALLLGFVFLLRRRRRRS